MGSISLADLESAYRHEQRRYLRVAAAIVRDEGLAEEAVQEAFARAVRARSGFRGEGPLEAWLWRAVVNEARRLAGRRREIVEEPAHLLDNGQPEPDVALRSLIAALPERQRLVLFLRYYADLDYRAIARVLDVEVGTVSATLHAAHAALRTAMEGVRT